MAILSLHVKTVVGWYVRTYATPSPYCILLRTFTLYLHVRTRSQLMCTRALGFISHAASREACMRLSMHCILDLF